MDKKLYTVMLLVYIGAGLVIVYRAYQMGPGPSDADLIKALENGASNVVREQVEAAAAAKATEN